MTTSMDECHSFDFVPGRRRSSKLPVSPFSTPCHHVNLTILPPLSSRSTGPYPKLVTGVSRYAGRTVT